ncbi:MAG: PD-(D/E)XK nuclease family protein, partial [Candidatus Electryoneaceae bacterium]|nr:PD-(D/E)XK nuclease family protein [Candidatus Electryoneaceae bacterium]
MNEGLTTLARDDNLFLGSVWHSVLEIWYGAGDHDSKIEQATLLIDQSFPNRQTDTRQRRDWHLCHAMFKGYRDCYPEDEFKVLGVEMEFVVPIINPVSGRSSRTFELRGKVDGLAQLKGSGELFLLEHKSAAQITGDYIERLPSDFQINLYSMALSRFLKLNIAGVIYSITCKARLKQSEGETEEQFEIRKAELIAKSKSGKSSAKRRLPESDDKFRARLTEKYRDPALFHREILYLSRQDADRTQREIWELTKQILTAKRGDVWTPNWDNCFRFGNQPCMYWALCRS